MKASACGLLVLVVSFSAAHIAAAQSIGDPELSWAGSLELGACCSEDVRPAGGVYTTGLLSAEGAVDRMQFGVRSGAAAINPFRFFLMSSIELSAGFRLAIDRLTIRVDLLTLVPLPGRAENSEDHDALAVDDLIVRAAADVYGGWDRYLWRSNVGLIARGRLAYFPDKHLQLLSTLVLGATHEVYEGSWRREWTFAQWAGTFAVQLGWLNLGLSAHIVLESNTDTEGALVPHVAASWERFELRLRTVTPTDNFATSVLLSLSLR